MELIAEISDKTVGARAQKVSKWRFRRAARTVLINRKGEVVLLHARKFDYYKIPGGGHRGI